MSMQERRSKDRRETTLRAEVRGAGQCVVGEVRNLSLEGAGLALPAAVEEGEVSLALALVDDEGAPMDASDSVELPATVVWTAEVAERRWAVGLSFDALDPTIRPRLERFLSSLDE